MAVSQFSLLELEASNGKCSVGIRVLAVMGRRWLVVRLMLVPSVWRLTAIGGSSGCSVRCARTSISWRRTTVVMRRGVMMWLLSCNLELDYKLSL